MPLAEIFEDRLASHPEQEPIDILRELGPKFGIGHFTYFSRRAVTSSTASENVILTTYPGDWLTRYQEERYHLIDPVISLGMNSILPLDWSLIPQNSSLVRKFFGEAADFGVSPRGLTVSLRDAQNNRNRPIGTALQSVLACRLT